MMEEVSDDTNGESTFEFVGDKSDESTSKDSASQGDSEKELPSMEQVLPFFQTTNTQPSMIPSSTEPVATSSGASASTSVSSIPFYDPSQYQDTQTTLFTPYIPQQENTNVPPSNQYMSTQQSSQVAGVPSQSYQPPPLPQQHKGSGEGGVWGWIKGTQFLNKVAEKAKSSVDSVITTLDPGMKEIINSGGDINVIVASGNEAKVSAVREAFQQVFGKATVQGIPVQASSIAPQPVGYSAGLKAAEERIGNIRQQGLLQGNHVLLAVENFIAELTPDNWFDIGCLLLQDYNEGISLQVYTEAIPISSHFVQQAKDQTPADYPLGWSGHAVTIGQIIGSAMGVHHSEWHQAMTGVSRREILFLAAKTIAGLYKSQLRR
ncbi:Protein PRRC1 like protein [Argiope bruennichi]|uniref:Protein PRRC1 like protein n=1 Tax=Argiope bruennichi TaxID=94029 RepID=A0A8T0FLV5_ARGBR|nr:Protein PRRC1 like protein [Argiope bruennichi]